MRLFLHRFPLVGGLQLFALLCAVIAGITTTNAATLIVTTINDNGPGSLRQALANAVDGDTIQFDPALNGQTILLTSAELVIDKNITINGPGQSLLTVARDSNAPNFRIFHILPGHTVIIEGLTISGGNTVSEPGAGGVWNDHSTLTIDSCAVRDNFAHFLNGGGIYNDGSGGKATLAILNSAVSGNTAFTLSGASSAGGGIYNHNSNGGSATLTIVNSSITGNAAWYLQSPNSSGGFGGGIYISALNGGSATLTITNSIVSDNLAGPPVGPFPDFRNGYGGGITNYGALTTITNSTISGNQAGLWGGGIDNSGVLTITNSTISGNSTTSIHDGVALGNGGGISNTGPLTITNSSLTNNTTGNSGGGLYGNSTITNSTISGNSALQGDGGAIYGFGSITNSTISGNRASGNGGGISATGALEIGNTVLKAGASGANIFNNGGTVTSHGYNLSSDSGGGFLTATGDQINTDPILGPLQNNGGPTFTHDLLPGSPAINAGDPNFTPPPSTDQRGYARVFNGRVDIGSLEVQPTPPPITLSGTISYCSNPIPGPVPNVTLTLTGSMSGTTLSNGSGNYSFSGLVFGGTYTVTPTKAALSPGSADINTTDVIAVQRHFLIIGTPLSGCRLTAADVNGDTLISTVDVIAIQRFFLQLTTGIASVGSYQFTPTNRTYPNLKSNQTDQNYDTLVFGDVAPPFVE